MGFHHFISSLTHQKWHGHVGFSVSCGSPGGMLAWPHYLQLGYLWNHSVASYASSLAADGRGGCSTQCGDVSWFRTASVLRHQFARGGYGCTPFLRGTHPKTEWWNLQNFRWKWNVLFETDFNLFGFHCSLGGLGPTAGKSCTFVVFWRMPLYPQLVYTCDFKCTWARFSSITAAMLAVQEWQMACQLFFCQRAALRLQHVTETPPVGFSNMIFVQFLLGTKKNPITFPTKTKKDLVLWRSGDFWWFNPNLPIPSEVPILLMLFGVMPYRRCNKCWTRLGCGEGFGKPDMVAYSGAISASAMGARWEDALALCADMTSKRLSADVTWKKTHWERTLLDLCPFFGFWLVVGDARFCCISRVMFEWFMPVCQRVKVICYNAIIQACGGQWKKALQALEDLQQQMLQFLASLTRRPKLLAVLGASFLEKLGWNTDHFLSSWCFLIHKLLIWDFSSETLPSQGWLKTFEA